jgi:hypothetical protein
MTLSTDTPSRLIHPRSSYGARIGLLLAALLMATLVEDPQAAAQSPVSEIKDSTGATLMTVFDNGALDVGQLNGFVGVNRATPLSGSSNEVFGLQAPTSGNDFGGMYIDTESSGGRPYYGYASDDVIRAFHYYDNGEGAWNLALGGSDKLTIADNGRVEIGTTVPDIGAPRVGILEDGTGEGMRITLDNSSNNANGFILDHGGTGDLITAITSSDNASNLRFVVDNDGNVSADGTISGGGADVAEAFDVEGSPTTYEPGDVLTISTTQDRTVAKSRTAQSTRVVGVYATKPGVLLSENGTETDMATKVPMGVVGVLPTKVSAESGAIERGDLLVTAETPGHAMKAQPTVINGTKIYPQGAILGKALENFDGSGTGTIKVLVNVK